MKLKTITAARNTLLIIVLSLLGIINAYAESTSDSNESSKFLPVDEAFALSYDGSKEDRVSIHFDIAERYYLYQQRLWVKINGEKINLPNLPEAELKQDPNFGEVYVYHHQLKFDFTKPAPTSGIEIGYQGCAEDGLCYPPQKRTLQAKSLEQNQTDTTEVEVVYESVSDKYLNSFTDKSALYTLLIYFLVGVATAFAGCSYPMFPILSKIIIGQKDTSQLKSFSLSVAYVLPIALVYASIGILAGGFGSNLANWFQTPIAILFISALLFAMALSMLGLFQLQMPASIQSKLSNISNQQSGGSYASAAIMGFISAFIVSACVVPPVVAAVTYITKTGNIWLGAGAMFCFGIGLGSPLLLLGLSAGWLLPKAGNWMDNIQRVMALFLISAAIWIVDRVIPDWITTLLWAALALFAAVYLYKLFNKGFMLPISAALTLIAALVIYTGFTKEFSHQEQHYEFINSKVEFNQLLEQNKQDILFIDFYADWCTACKHMENTIFLEPKIAQQLSQFRRIKIDLSQMNEENLELMKQYNIIGPPAFLFITPDGKELSKLRIIGELKSEQFSEVLSKALSYKDG